MNGGDMDDDAAAMAQAMGFSSFGAQNPTKRRKYNPAADASTGASPSSSLPLHHNTKSRGTGSGSNTTPLGERRPTAVTSTAVNDEEIDLDDDDDGDGDGVDGHTEDVKHDVEPAGGADNNVDHGEDEQDDDPAPQYIDTSRPPTSFPPAADFAPTHTNTPSSSHRGRGSHGSGAGSHRGDRNHQWWDDYYDPAVNVNPWEKLEKQLGMEPRGKWMSWEESKGAWEKMKASTAPS